MRSRILMSVGWPAFLAACVLELVVFAVVDPAELHWLRADGQAWSRSSVYTLAFVVFWLITFAAGALTAALAQPGEGGQRKE